MEEFINNAVKTITDIMSTLGPLSGFALVVLESMIPILPLAVFVALNFVTFGTVFGFILSWVATIVGCILMFFLCRKLQEKFLKKYEKDPKISKIRNKITNISFPNLVLIMAIPFTPAFAVNIGAGLSDISFKKYFCALLISKISIIYFWGFIGKSLIESFTDITVLIEIAVMLLAALLVSKIANKFLKL